jgi:hypothetical protein
MLVAWLLCPSGAPANLAAAVALCLLWVAGTRINGVPWTQAAARRDAVLVAVAQLRAGGCTAVWIRNVPDSVRGAYVFRNGLPEAIAPVTVTSAAPRACWTDIVFAP